MHRFAAQHRGDLLLCCCSVSCLLLGVDGGQARDSAADFGVAQVSAMAMVWSVGKTGKEVVVLGGLGGRAWEWSAHTYSSCGSDLLD